MIDQFNKLVELAVLPAQNAALTAKAFLSYFVTPFGCLFFFVLFFFGGGGGSRRYSENNLLQAFSNFWRSLRQGLHITIHLLNVKLKISTD